MNKNEIKPKSRLLVYFWPWQDDKNSVQLHHFQPITIQLGSAKLPSCAFVGCNICRRKKFHRAVVSLEGRSQFQVAETWAWCRQQDNERLCSIWQRPAHCHSSSIPYLCKSQVTNPYIVHISFISRPFTQTAKNVSWFLMEFSIFWFTVRADGQSNI